MEEISPIFVKEMREADEMDEKKEVESKEETSIRE